MEADPNIFKKAKPEIEQQIQGMLQGIENSAGIEIPQDLQGIFAEAFEMVFPNNQEQLDNLILTIDSDINFLTTHMIKPGVMLDDDCKDFIDGMLNELFNLTEGKGVECAFWKHMPQIWYFNAVVEGFSKTDTTNAPIEFQIDQVLNAYSKIYEMTISFLTDICLKIADKKSASDPFSKGFIKEYQKRAKKNMTIDRGTLIKYLKCIHL